MRTGLALLESKESKVNNQFARVVSAAQSMIESLYLYSWCILISHLTCVVVLLLWRIIGLSGCNWSVFGSCHTYR